MKAAQEKIAFAGGARAGFKHVIYIIKENRTYDQILGDLSRTASRWATATRALRCMARLSRPTSTSWPAIRRARQLLRFRRSLRRRPRLVEAAIGTDYLEKTWQQNYRGEQRSYDYEGVVADGYPLLQKFPT
jgi:hypothetical protein